MKTPIVITTLEEDFKKIGLIKATPMVESVEADEVDETELDEAARIKRRVVRKAGGGFAVQKTQKTTAAERMAAKKFRRSAAGKKSAKLAMKKRRSAKGKRLTAKTAAVAAAKGTRGKGEMMGMPMGGKGDYGMSMEAFDAAEALKSFANAAIIAERLQTVFTEWVKSDLCESREDETEFLKLAGALATIAEEFAEIATALNESVDELDEEAVTEIFNEGLETVLDAVDLYEKNCGKGEDEEEMDDSEDEEEESDDEGND